MSCTRYASMASLRRRILSGAEPAWLSSHARYGYIRQAVLASPPWVDRKAMRALAIKRREVTAQTGVYHVLDHIVPLTGPKMIWPGGIVTPRVHGLNVPWNLRLVPFGSNAHKSNHFVYGHGELFAEPEQLRLL